MLLDEKVKIGLDRPDFFRCDFRRGCSSQSIHLGGIGQLLIVEKAVETVVVVAARGNAT